MFPNILFGICAEIGYLLMSNSFPDKIGILVEIGSVNRNKQRLLRILILFQKGEAVVLRLKNQMRDCDSNCSLNVCFNMG